MVPFGLCRAMVLYLAVLAAEETTPPGRIPQEPPFGHAVAADRNRSETRGETDVRGDRRLERPRGQGRQRDKRLCQAHVEQQHCVHGPPRDRRVPLADRRGGRQGDGQAGGLQGPGPKRGQIYFSSPKRGQIYFSGGGLLRRRS